MKYRKYPCLIDLHLHLDGSLSLKSIKKIAALQEIPITESDEEIIKKISVSDECRNLNEYLEKFSFPNKFLQTKEGIKYAVYNLCEELKEQGLIYAEIRFAPQKSTEKGLTQDEAVNSAIDGLKMTDFNANLILCCMRGKNNKSENIETINTAEKYIGKGVAAIDLAGAEALFPTSDYKDLFQLAGEKNIPFTIHAGEAAGAESVYKALEYGAKRIGHGVQSIYDLELMKKIALEGITLELCPTSNLNTSIFSDISEYPLKKFIDSKINVTINTDNISVSSTNINKEFNIIAQTFGLCCTDIEQLLLNAAEASFADDKTKSMLKNKIISAYSALKDDERISLVNAAFENLKYSYAPYSHFNVSAAVLTADGTVFTGVNVENASYTAGICAERNAVFNAVSNGYKKICAIAIVGGKNGFVTDYCPPCGICRQVMREFASSCSFRIITAKSADEYKETTLQNLLPESFGPEFL